MKDSCGMVSVIIVNWNTRALLLECLESVHRTLDAIPFEVLVVDNASVDDSVVAVRAAYPSVKVMANNQNRGFAAANNRALKQMAGRYALLLNTDTILTQGAVKTLIDFMEKNGNAGMVCGQLLNRDGTRQNSFANFPGVWSLLFNESLLSLLFPGRFPGKRTQTAEPMEVDSCIGACMMVRKAAIDAVGLLDEAYFFFFEETDWAKRMQQWGWRVFFLPTARIYHLQGQSVGHHVKSRKLFFRSRYTYLKKWHQKTYPLFFMLVFCRLLLNNLLNLAGFIATFGMNKKMGKKLSIYIQLLVWHLKGCRGIGGEAE